MGDRAEGLRIAVLFSRLSGYMATCLRTLVERYGVRLLVIRIPPSEVAPFDDRYFDWIEQLYDRDALNIAQMETLLHEFAPDAIFMSGWFDRGYLRVARAMRNRGVLVVAGSDAQWTGSWRQQLGRYIAPWYLHSAIDVLWVAGERQRELARRLGYVGERCWSGYYACDWEQFRNSEKANGVEWSSTFLYVGRYVAAKGIEVLIKGYQEYRARASDPWGLVCAGTGEQAFMLKDVEIVNQGFVQPSQLPQLMHSAAAFVLPSLREPWGVVLQEAAAAGLPLICSDACGAAVHLLQDRYNGYLVETGSVEGLADAFLYVSQLSADDLNTMSRRSIELSKQFTPTRWARMLAEGIERLKPQVDL